MPCQPPEGDEPPSRGCPFGFTFRGSIPSHTQTFKALASARPREEAPVSRVSQKRASRGSQKWIQALVNRAPHLLDRAIAPHLNLSPTDKIVWLSPLAGDAYAEYRDEMFLSKIEARTEDRGGAALRLLAHTGSAMGRARANEPG